MRLLLDTHIIVWAASGVDAFEPRVAALLTTTRHELWMSAVYEIEAKSLPRHFAVPPEARGASR